MDGSALQLMPHKSARLPAISDCIIVNLGGTHMNDVSLICLDQNLQTKELIGAFSPRSRCGSILFVRLALGENCFVINKGTLNDQIRYLGFSVNNPNNMKLRSRCRKINIKLYVSKFMGEEVHVVARNLTPENFLGGTEIQGNWPSYFPNNLQPFDQCGVICGIISRLARGHSFFSVVAESTNAKMFTQKENIEALVATIKAINARHKLFYFLTIDPISLISKKIIGDIKSFVDSLQVVINKDLLYITLDGKGRDSIIYTIVEKIQEILANSSVSGPSNLDKSIEALINDVQAILINFITPFTQDNLRVVGSANWPAKSADLKHLVSMISQQPNSIMNEPSMAIVATSFSAFTAGASSLHMQGMTSLPSGLSSIAGGVGIASGIKLGFPAVPFGGINMNMGIPAVQIPSIQLPAIQMLQNLQMGVQMPNMQMQNLELPNVNMGMQMPNNMPNVNIGMPNVNMGMQMPNINMPNVNMPNVNMPNVNMPNVNMPNANMPNVNMPNVNMPNNVQIPNVNMPNFSFTNTSTSNVNMPVCESKSVNNYNQTYDTVTKNVPTAPSLPKSSNSDESPLKAGRLAVDKVAGAVEHTIDSINTGPMGEITEKAGRALSHAGSVVVGALTSDATLNFLKGLGDIAVAIPVVGIVGAAMKSFFEMAAVAKYNKVASDLLARRVQEVGLALNELLAAVPKPSASMDAALKHLVEIINNVTTFVEKFASRGYLSRLLSGSSDDKQVKAFDKELADSVMSIQMTIGITTIKLQQRTLSELDDMKNAIASKVKGSTGGVEALSLTSLSSDDIAAIAKACHVDEGDLQDEIHTMLVNIMTSQARMEKNIERLVGATDPASLANERAKKFWDEYFEKKSVALDEFCVAFQEEYNNGAKLSGETKLRLSNTLDNDGDGTVSYIEWKRWYKAIFIDEGVEYNSSFNMVQFIDEFLS